MLVKYHNAQKIADMAEGFIEQPEVNIVYLLNGLPAC